MRRSCWSHLDALLHQVREAHLAAFRALLFLLLVFVIVVPSGAGAILTILIII